MLKCYGMRFSPLFFVVCHSGTMLKFALSRPEICSVPKNFRGNIAPTSSQPIHLPLPKSPTPFTNNLSTNPPTPSQITNPFYKQSLNQLTYLLPKSSTSFTNDLSTNSPINPSTNSPINLPTVSPIQTEWNLVNVFGLPSVFCLTWQTLFLLLHHHVMSSHEPWLCVMTLCYDSV